VPKLAGTASLPARGAKKFPRHVVESKLMRAGVGDHEPVAEPYRAGHLHERIPIADFDVGIPTKGPDSRSVRSAVLHRPHRVGVRPPGCPGVWSAAAAPRQQRVHAGGDKKSVPG
jgi:hypothetical protein